MDAILQVAHGMLRQLQAHSKLQSGSMTQKTRCGCRTLLRTAWEFLGPRLPLWYSILTLTNDKIPM